MPCWTQQGLHQVPCPGGVCAGQQLGAQQARPPVSLQGAACSPGAILGPAVCSRSSIGFSHAPSPQVNLFLRVVRRREDGFHDLASLFHVSASPQGVVRQQRCQCKSPAAAGCQHSPSPTQAYQRAVHHPAPPWRPGRRQIRMPACMHTCHCLTHTNMHECSDMLVETCVRWKHTGD
jgi:hypothetical protein